MKTDPQGPDTPEDEATAQNPQQPETTEVARSELGELKELRKALEEERSKAERFLANWQRAQADYLNFKRRVEDEKQELTKYAGVTLAAVLLPVIDDVERALRGIPADLANFTWVDGLFLIYRKLLAALESQGLRPIEAQGKPFDPRLHEAVLYGEGEEGKVLAELQRGYMFKDMTLRPALVKVGKRPESPPATPPAAIPQDDGEASTED